MAAIGRLTGIRSWLGLGNSISGTSHLWIHIWEEKRVCLSVGMACIRIYIFVFRYLSVA